MREWIENQWEFARYMARHSWWVTEHAFVEWIFAPLALAMLGKEGCLQVYQWLTNKSEEHCTVLNDELEKSRLETEELEAELRELEAKLEEEESK